MQKCTTTDVIKLNVKVDDWVKDKAEKYGVTTGKIANACIEMVRATDKPGNNRMEAELCHRIRRGSK